MASHESTGAESLCESYNQEATFANDIKFTGILLALQT